MSSVRDVLDKVRNPDERTIVAVIPLMGGRMIGPGQGIPVTVGAKVFCSDGSVWLVDSDDKWTRARSSLPGSPADRESNPLGA